MATLYVGNLSYSVTHADLEELFSQVGTVKCVDIIIDKYSGQSRRYGFVYMASDEEVQAVIKRFDGYDLVRTLRVNKVNEEVDLELFFDDEEILCELARGKLARGREREKEPSATEGTCPVCGRVPEPGEVQCPLCDWELESEYVLGRLTPEEKAGYQERLELTRRWWQERQQREAVQRELEATQAELAMLNVLVVSRREFEKTPREPTTTQAEFEHLREQPETSRVLCPACCWRGKCKSGELRCPQCGSTKLRQHPRRW